MTTVDSVVQKAGPTLEAAEIPPRSSYLRPPKLEVIGTIPPHPLNCTKFDQHLVILGIYDFS